MSVGGLDSLKLSSLALNGNDFIWEQEDGGISGVKWQDLDRQIKDLF